MSSYLVLKGVSFRLRDLLWQAINSDAVLGPFVNNEMNISLTNPTETSLNEQNKLSLWLYQVSENEFAKNRPAIRTSTAETRQLPPLTLNLNYLITPTGPAYEAEYQQLLLGLVMQTLYDQSIVPLRDNADGIAEELHIVLCRLSLEELAHVWEALRQPYRLSVCYQVAVARIDSNRTIGAARVVEEHSGYRSKSEDDRGETG
jgi:hypothetical protein